MQKTTTIFMIVMANVVWFGLFTPHRCLRQKSEYFQSFYNAIFEYMCVYEVLSAKQQVHNRFYETLSHQNCCFWLNLLSSPTNSVKRKKEDAFIRCTNKYETWNYSSIWILLIHFNVSAILYAANKFSNKLLVEIFQHKNSLNTTISSFY